jgi:hypothetical protein
LVGQYHSYIVQVTTEVVPADFTRFTMVGRYHFYVVQVTAEVVPAGHT